MIVTFCCSKSVHVYSEKSSLKPMSPYKLHNTIESAKKHLRDRGISKPNIIRND